MHEHGGEECQRLAEGIGEEAVGYESPLLDKGVTPAQFYKEEQDVKSDQDIGNQGKGSARGIIITDWQHGVSLLLLQLELSRFQPALV
jgi:hypothetical protein